MPRLRSAQAWWNLVVHTCCRTSSASILILLLMYWLYARFVMYWLYARFVMYWLYARFVHMFYPYPSSHVLALCQVCTHVLSLSFFLCTGSMPGLYTCSILILLLMYWLYARFVNMFYPYPSSHVLALLPGLYTCSILILLLMYWLCARFVHMVNEPSHCN